MSKAHAEKEGQFLSKNNLTWLKMMGEIRVCLGSKEIKFLAHLDHFSKYLKYLRNFEKRSKLTKNSD